MSRLVSFYGDSLVIGSGVGAGYRATTESLFPSETFTVNTNNTLLIADQLLLLNYESLKYYPDIIFLNAGNHDAVLATPTATATYKADVKTMLQNALDKSPAKKVYFISTLPVDDVGVTAVIDDYNIAAQEAIAEIGDSRLAYVDTYNYMEAQGFTRPDGTHYATSSMEACASAVFEPLLTSALVGVTRASGYLNRQNKLGIYLISGPALRGAQPDTLNGSIPMWSKSGNVTATLANFADGGYKYDDTVQNYCIDFDGAGKVDLNYQLQSYTAVVQTDKTFEFWILRGASTNHVLFEQYFDSNNFIVMRLNGDNFHVQAKSSGAVRQWISEGVVSSDVVHVVYVKSGFVHLIYANGSLVPLSFTSNMLGGGEEYAENVDIDLGISTASAANNFQGKILSHAVYDYAIDADDAAEMYSYGSGYDGVRMDAAGSLFIPSSRRPYQTSMSYSMSMGAI